MVQEIGKRGTEFDSRNHSQIDDCSETVTLGEYTREVGGIVFWSEIIPKNSIQERYRLLSSAR